MHHLIFLLFFHVLIDLVPCHSLCFNSVYHSPPDMHPCKLLCQAAPPTYSTILGCRHLIFLIMNQIILTPYEPYHYQLTWIIQSPHPLQACLEFYLSMFWPFMFHPSTFSNRTMLVKQSTHCVHLYTQHAPAGTLELAA